MGQQVAGRSASRSSGWAWTVVLFGLTVALVVTLSAEALGFGCGGDDPFLVDAPQVEIYDGVDNDCDGLIDEGMFEIDGRIGPAVVQLALVQVEPDAVEVGGTSEVSALVRVTLDTELASAEYRVGDGEWLPMSATALPRTADQPKDHSVEVTTDPFPAPGDTDVCVRATDTLGAVSTPGCVTVTVTGTAQDPELPVDDGDDGDGDDGSDGADDGSSGEVPGPTPGGDPEPEGATDDGSGEPVSDGDPDDDPVAGETGERTGDDAAVQEAGLSGGQLPRTGVPLAGLVVLGLVGVLAGSYLRR